MGLERVGIKDGTGNGYTAKVNSDNQLTVRVVIVSALHNASLKGDAFAWNAVSANRATTDNLLLVNNDSTSRWLVIDHCYIVGDIAGQMDFKLLNTAALTLDGTVVVGVNLNRGSNKIADATAKSNDAQTGTATIFYTIYQHLAENTQGTTAAMKRVDFEGAIILGENDAFGIDTILEPAAGFEATAIGYFLDK